MYMKDLYALIFWLFLMLPLLCLGQSREDCRLKTEDLRPVIARFNPFFADHTWDQDNQMEMARMGQGRLLIITQDGCKRHHTTFTLILDPGEVVLENAFWMEEVNTLMHKVYWEQLGYEVFGEDFEAQFDKQFQLYGLNRRFNFPIGTRNFICELLYDPRRGARINIEMVSFLFKETIHEKRSGIPEDQDDGWLGNRGDGKK
jgi:hypothetical protein